MKTRAEMDKAAFGRRVYTIRRERQITSERLSVLCAVNPTHIRQIENATRLPSLPVFVRMCNELHVAPNFFLVDSLVWDEEDAITALDERLRVLSPCQLSTVLDTINTLIDKLVELEAPKMQ
jgi:transcriptional regulator with XRE-family HTH domain